MLDILSTEGLIEAGAVDYLWNSGWRKATPDSLHRAQHGHPDDNPVVGLPERAVLSCFTVAFPEVVAALGAHGGRYVLVVRDGDPSLQDGGGPNCNVRGWPPNVAHVFGSAMISANDRGTPVPMAFHAFTGWVKQVEPMLDVPRTKDNKVLVGFSLDLGGVTARDGSERMAAVRYFGDKPWATVFPGLLTHQHGTITYSWPWDKYAALLRSHDYLCCPVGYGVERVAGWEAMVLGCIPIMLGSHPELNHFVDMPILFVNAWSDVTPELCDANLHLIERSQDKLKLSYWVERITAKRSAL